jgi:hypothetical protein
MGSQRPGPGDGSSGPRIGHWFVGTGAVFLLVGAGSLVAALAGPGGGQRAFLLCVAVPLLVSGLRILRLGLIGLRA